MDRGPGRWVKRKIIPNGTLVLLLCSDFLNADCRRRGTGEDRGPGRWVKRKTIPNGTLVLLLCSDLLNAWLSPERYW